MDSVNVMELAIKAIAIKFYDDSKESLKSLLNRSFAPSIIEDYLKKELNYNTYIKNILFGSERIQFDLAYHKHKIEVAGNIIKNFEVSNLFLTYNHLTLVGPAGIGKSTFVQYLFRESIKSKYKIPINIELRTIGKNHKLAALIEEKLSTSSGSVPNAFIEDQLKKGNFIIFFDGYDEVTNENIEFVNALLIESGKNYKKNDILLTSRPYANVEFVNSFKVCKLLPFDDKDVEDFISRISFFYEPEFISNLKLTISNNNNTNKVRDYLSNPLLLSLYILSFQMCTPDIPTKISNFYNQVVTALFQQHDTVSKNSFKRVLKTKLNKGKVERFLTKFSFMVTMKDKYSFSKTDILNEFDLLKKKFEIDFDNEAFCEDMTKSLALWVILNGEYRFSHRSLQEYFFARSISILTRPTKEKYYNTLITMLTTESSKMQMREVSNKLQLLNEMDFRAFSEFFYIPLSEYRFDLAISSDRELIENFIKFSIACSNISILQELNEDGEIDYSCIWSYSSRNSRGVLNISLNNVNDEVGQAYNSIVFAMNNTILRSMDKLPLKIVSDKELFVEVFTTKEDENMNLIVDLLLKDNIAILIREKLESIMLTLNNLKETISYYDHDQLVDLLEE